MTAIYGHRGARGLFPENTLEGVNRCLNYPINGIELDVVVSKDHQLIVSHNPFAHRYFCLDKSGNEIRQHTTNNFHQLDYKDIKLFDVGSKLHPNYPKQQKIKAHIPLLTAMFELLNSKVNRPFTLFLEIKCESSIYYPKTSNYVQLLNDFLMTHSFNGQLIIKSFNIDFLNEFHRTAKEKYQLGLLVENKNTAIENLSSLNFKPTFYNSEYSLINHEMVKYLHQQQIKVVAWTVNNKTDFEKMVALKVDGIISDFPNKMI
jgi:glycerophosphoryl diester phosphodiesterase